MIAREDQALPADQSQRPPLGVPDPAGEGKPPGIEGKQQPEGQGKPPELPPLHFPQQPGGQDPAPAPGGYPPPAGYPPPGGSPWDRQAPPPGQPPDAPPRWGSRPQPGGPTRPGRPLRPPEPAIRQRALAAVLLGLVSLLALLGVGTNFHRGIYLVVFSFVVGIAACWLGVTSIRRARRSGSMRPRGAVAGTVLGVIGALLGAVLLIAFATFWQQLNSFSQCLNAANTPSAQQACLNQLHKSVGISGLGPGA